LFKKVVVTGAAGFIGGHLVQHLAHQGVDEIVAIDSLRSGNWFRVPSSVKRITADIADYSVEKFSDVLNGADVLFHLAAEKYNSSKSTPERLLVTNVLASERLFRAAAMTSVRRSVFTSSLYAYGSMGPHAMKETDLPRPTTLYGASKVMGEHMLRSVDRELGLSWNVARLFFVYGPNQFAEGGYKSVIVSNFERLLHNKKPIVRGDGLQSLDYIYVDDCVHALIKLATSHIDKQVVNVASGNAVSIIDLTSMMTRVSGALPSYSSEPADWTHGSNRFGDASLIQDVFGWKSTTSLEIGLKRTFLSMKDSHNADV
jgi:UDP-glucose 4-epimerase